MDFVLDSVTTRSCVVILILNDVVSELPEDFTVRMIVNDEHADTATEAATVTIISDEDGRFKYNNSRFIDFAIQDL